ncbi:MAG: TIGR02757 family protein [Bacteroides sp.]|nr:TIGR02757 family protein [Bacteroides sp.]
MDKEMINRLRDWANRYNTPDFIPSDPVQFPHRYKEQKDIEISAFLTSWISYGNRKMILRKAEELHTAMGVSPYRFITERRFEPYQQQTGAFYRFYSWNDLYGICDRLYELYQEHPTLEDALLQYDKKDPVVAVRYAFEGIKGVPRTPASACKRVAIFLRWMVRRDGIINFGLWQQYHPSILLIPLDTHVHTVALNLGLTERKAADIRTAREITAHLQKIWPDDPCLGDFALFGYGVNNPL